MNVYSYYYGATVERGIDVQAQSRELVNTPASSMLRELASMHALESSEHKGEMLSYLVRKDRFSILGLSYTESPKSSGYNRGAPCGLQYVTETGQLREAADDLGRIVNFVTFQKPNSPSPAPMDAFPMSESGYYYHNHPSILAPIVDGLMKVATSDKNGALLIALPKGKTSENATARYTIAEALNCLPGELRINIRFFTGLPVAEGINDPLAGFSNAVDRFGANVVFCPNEYYQRIRTHQICIGVDMDQAADSPAGSYARYIANASDVSISLLCVKACLGNRNLSLQALDTAAERVEQEGFSIPSATETEGLKARIRNLQDENVALQRELNRLKQQSPYPQVYPAYQQQNPAGWAPDQTGSYTGPSKQSNSGKSSNKSAQAQKGQSKKMPEPPRAMPSQEQQLYEEKKSGLPLWLKIILAVLIIGALGVGAFFGAKTLTDMHHNKDSAPTEQPASQETAQPTPTEEPGEAGALNGYFLLLENASSGHGRITA